MGGRGRGRADRTIFFFLLHLDIPTLNHTLMATITFF
jgi:hypothetical protein